MGLAISSKAHDLMGTNTFELITLSPIGIYPASGIPLRGVGRHKI